MIQLTKDPVFLNPDGRFSPSFPGLSREEGRKRTMAYQILESHNQSQNMEQLELKFDALVSPDNNYVNILQTARAGGVKEFPVPYVLTNCHNTLCAVGGTISEDDHVYGLGNVKRYGGIFVPPYRAVLHQYMRETMAGCKKMILGSDSHTRYGALGTLGIGEGGGEIAKQLLGRTYDISYPPVIAVRLTGSPAPGVGPQDIALALAAAVFQKQFVKNKILEFIGPGIQNLSMEYRMGVDVMTTESGALSSIWCTDGKTREYLKDHGREGEYAPLEPQAGACYDGLIEIDLSQAECMIALPFHPSNALPIREFKANMRELLMEVEEQGRRIKGSGGKPFSIMHHIKDGEFYADQALVSGCSGGMFENIAAMADILKGYAIPGNGIGLGINPASLPVMADLMKQGIAGELLAAGAILRPCICGPCFGVTDVPADNQISLRHVTRNYPNREGSKPGQGQMAAVCLMDARSIAATVRCGGRLTAATELEVEYRPLRHQFDPKIYQDQVFNQYRKPDPKAELVMGPNIADWPKMYAPGKHLLMKVTGAYEGSVTTDELIPSGEASSFRSNPEKISQYLMISRDPEYVGRAKRIRSLEGERRNQAQQGDRPQTEDPQLNQLLAALTQRLDCGLKDIMVAGLMAGQQIGDGSSREQAASCQKVLGGFGNLANEYATKRYRSNLINWGILPMRTDEKLPLPEGTWVLVENLPEILNRQRADFSLQILNPENGIPERTMEVTLDHLTGTERKILRSGCLINYYAEENESWQ